MSIERCYRFLHRNRGTVSEIAVSYIIATLSNVLSSYVFSSFFEFLSELFTFNLSISLMWMVIVLWIIFMLFHFILEKCVIRIQAGHKLKKIIEEHSDAIFSSVIDENGYSWGYDRTLYCCDNIIEGWKPGQIVFEKLNSSVKPLPSLLEKDYKDFMKTEYAQNIVNHGNNNRRWMIEDIQPNFSKSEKKIFLSMRQTDFCTASCIWNLWRNSSPDIRKEEVIENTFKSRTREYLPHSFCLHLAVVTKDEKVVVTTISRFKENDYAKTKAVTIGEQIEGTDFYDNVSFHGDAVERWTRRALKEEMGIDDSQYTSMTARDSLHVLSINFEGDIYNFSLMAVLDIRLTYEDFVDEVCRNPARDKEFNTMEGLDIIRIPEILRNSGRKDEKDKFHPSSLLRMYLVYIHYYGIKKFVKEYERHPDAGKAQ